MLEWLRLIKTSMSASNSNVSLAGVRSFDSTQSATSPPTSPRSTKSSSLIELFVSALLQNKSPEIGAENIASWFDGLSMTEVASSALMGTLCLIAARWFVPMDYCVLTRPPQTLCARAAVSWCV
jgi:hypothetical protein